MARLRWKRKPKAPRAEPTGRFGRGVARVRRGIARYPVLRDTLGAVLIVMILVGTIAGATGGVWPPVLAVESSSMMHPLAETSYGRLGTIDVGDLIFIRGVDDPRADVETWVQGGRDHYGRPGDVIAFLRSGNAENITVIHRAITWVQVDARFGAPTKYTVDWTEGQKLVFDQRGIYLPALGFDEPNGFTPTNGYRPAASGFLTKGDNAITNPGVDQAIGISLIIDPNWVVGVAYGEVPWLGLAKLGLQSGRTNPDFPGYQRIGNAFAPIEQWSMFFLTVTLIILVPFTIDTIRAYRRDKRERAELEALRKREQRADEQTS